MTALQSDPELSSKNAPLLPCCSGMIAQTSAQMTVQLTDQHSPTQVFYKMDRAGHGEEICLADLPRNKGLSFVGFDHRMFLEVRLD